MPRRLQRRERDAAAVWANEGMASEGWLGWEDGGAGAAFALSRRSAKGEERWFRRRMHVFEDPPRRRSLTAV